MNQYYKPLHCSKEFDLSARMGMGSGRNGNVLIGPHGFNSVSYRDELYVGARKNEKRRKSCFVGTYRMIVPLTLQQHYVDALLRVEHLTHDILVFFVIQ